MVRYTPPPQSEEKEEQENTLEDFLEEKIGNLSDIVSHLQEEAKERTSLSERIIAQVYEHYMQVKNRLLALSPASPPHKAALEQQLDTLKHEVRQERVQCWQDLAALYRDMRQWVKQYSDVAQRVRLILSGDNKKKSEQED